MEKRRIIAEFLAKFYLRWDRGEVLTHFFTSIVHDLIMIGISMDLIYRYLHFRIPFWLMIVVVVVVPFVRAFIGYWDEKIGFWKFQNRYFSKELNPFFEEEFAKIQMKLDEIKKGRIKNN